MKKTWMKAKHLLKCEFFVYVFAASEQRLILSSAYSISVQHTHEGVRNKVCTRIHPGFE